MPKVRISYRNSRVAIVDCDNNHNRRGKTIGTTVTSAHIKKKTREVDMFLGKRAVGMSLCYGCNQCPYIHKGKDFIHPETGYVAHLRGHYTCVSKYVVYVLICPCGLIYIGQTTQMIKSRISQHRSSINLGNMSQPVSKHFIEKGHGADQLRLMVLEMVPPLKNRGDREIRLKQWEVWWIHKLSSL
ncbi:hypothetical protein XELAEV_18007738mg [Xenopus laevis]|uniref:GIY-YIG domain-containing protein n=1 Tax=Xenopus laevis TaxID=8355 RepID=A0A974I4R0_XENLA|nr:hypothetical protein XELAEV_18007738mg [Xenopus laevis]